MAHAALILTLLQLGASAAAFVQQVFIARVVGATAQTDGYQIALALILFIVQGLIATTLVNAFVPQLASLARDHVDRSRVFAFWAQVNVVAVACILALTLWIATPTLLSLTVAGLPPVARAWAIESLQIMVLAIPIAALSGLYTALLFASGDLKFAALAPITQNAVAAVFSAIAYLLIGFNAFPLSFVIGTGAGCLMLLARLHRRSLIPTRTPSYPRISTGTILTVAAGPLAVPILAAVPGFVERWFMSFFPVGQITILAYAGRVFSVAIAFGVSVGLVALAQWSADNRQEHLEKGGVATSRSAVNAVVFMTLPATLALIVMPDVVVRLLFGESEIDAGQLSIMSLVLSIYALSLLPVALIGVIMRGFYAVSDARSALTMTAVWVFLWVGFDLVLIPPYGIYGLATASVVAVWLALLIAVAMRRTQPWLSVWPDALLSRETLTILVSSVIAVGAASVTFRSIPMPGALVTMPLIVVGYVALSAAGGSSLAREVLRFTIRSKSVS